MDPGAQRIEHKVALAAFGDHHDAQRRMVGAQAPQTHDAAHFGQIQPDRDHADFRFPRDRGKGVREVTRLDDVADPDPMNEEVCKPCATQRMMIGNYGT